MKNFSKQGGFTILELMIAVFIVGVIIVVIAALTTQIFTVDRRQVEQVRSVEEARLQLERMSNIIRDANHIDCNLDGDTTDANEHWLWGADEYRLAIVADFNGDSALDFIQYEIDSGTQELTQSVTQASDPVNNPCVFDGQSTDQVVASYVRNQENSFKLFDYYTTGSSSEAPLSAPLDQATRSTVVRVGTHLQIDVDLSQEPGVTEVTTDSVPRTIAFSSGSGPSPSVSPTPTPTPTPSDSPTPTPSGSPTPTSTPSPTPTPAPTPSPSPTPEPPVVTVEVGWDSQFMDSCYYKPIFVDQARDVNDSCSVPGLVQTQVRWTVSGSADTCEGNWVGAENLDPTGGTSEGFWAYEGDFTVTCTNAGGSSQDTATIDRCAGCDWENGGSVAYFQCGTVNHHVLSSSPGRQDCGNDYCPGALSHGVMCHCFASTGDWPNPGSTCYGWSAMSVSECLRFEDYGLNDPVC